MDGFLFLQAKWAFCYHPWWHGWWANILVWSLQAFPITNTSPRTENGNYRGIILGFKWRWHKDQKLRRHNCIILYCILPVQEESNTVIVFVSAITGFSISVCSDTVVISLICLGATRYQVLLCIMYLAKDLNHTPEMIITIIMEIINNVAIKTKRVWV